MEADEGQEKSGIVTLQPGGGLVNCMLRCESRDGENV